MKGMLLNSIIHAKFLNSKDTRPNQYGCNLEDDNSRPKSIESELTLKEICSGNYLITRRDITETSREFYAEEWEYVTEKQGSWHEVVYANQKQKLRFDIEHMFDIESEMLYYRDLARKILTLTIMAVWRDQYTVACGAPIVPENIFIFDSSGLSSKDKYKLSFHILVHPIEYIARNNEEAKGFALAVVNALKFQASNTSVTAREQQEYSLISKMIDLQIYHNKASLRLVKSTKVDGSRQLLHLYTGCDISFKQTCITYAPKGIYVLPVIFKQIIADTTEDNDDDIVEDKRFNANQGIIDKVISLLPQEEREANEISYQTSNFIAFTRRSPSMCSLCKRYHEKDNTLMISYYPTFEGGAINVYKQCRHYSADNPGSKTSMFIGCIECAEAKGEIMNAIEQFKDREIVTKYKNIVEQLKIDPNNNDLLDQQSRLTKVINFMYRTPNFDLFSEWSDKEVYDEPYVRDYPIKRTLCIRAPMKMGKTKKMLEYIKTHCDDKMRIIILSFRKSFSEEVKKNFSDFTLYSDIKSGLLNENRLIVQLESLHRVDIQQTDLLIMDESELIIEQWDSGLFKNFPLAFAAFQYLLTYSKRVIFMDALLSNRSYRVLEKTRGLEGMYLMDNVYPREQETTYNIVETRGDWMYLLKEKLKEGPVAIMTNSITDCKALQQMYSSTKITCDVYNSETLKSVIKKVFNDVDKEWSKSNLIIMTPTVTAGVSFERSYYHYVFGLFNNSSCTVEVAIQMLGRVRDVKSKSYYVYMSKDKYFEPISRDAIIDHITRRVKMVDNGNIRCTYSESGKLEFEQDLYFELWIENQRIKALTRRDFGSRFCEIISKTGAIIKSVILPDELKEVSKQMDFEFSNTAKSVKEEKCRQIAESVLLEDEQVREIQERMDNDDYDVTIEERRAIAKYHLTTHYGILRKDTAIIDMDFVKAYNTDIAKKQFLHLNALAISQVCGMDKLLKSLKILGETKCRTSVIRADMQCSEVLNYNKDLASKKSDIIKSVAIHDIVNTKYENFTHIGLNSFLCLCGFSSAMDFTSVISNTKVTEVINTIRTAVLEKTNLKNVIEYIESGYTLKSAPRPSDADYEKLFIKFIKLRLKSFYDVTFSYTKKTDSYKLKGGKLFQFDHVSKKFIIANYYYTGLARDEIYNKQLIEMCLETPYSTTPEIQLWINKEQSRVNPVINKPIQECVKPVQECVKPKIEELHLPELRVKLADKDVYTGPSKEDIKQREQKLSDDIMDTFKDIPRDKDGKYMPRTTEEYISIYNHRSTILKAMHPDKKSARAECIILAPGYTTLRLINPERYKDSEIEKIREGNEELTDKEAEDLYNNLLQYAEQQELNDIARTYMRLEIGVTTDIELKNKVLAKYGFKSLNAQAI